MNESSFYIKKIIIILCKKCSLTRFQHNYNDENYKCAQFEIYLKI